MTAQRDQGEGTGPDLVRVVIGDTGICLDVVLVEGAHATPSIACVVVVGEDLKAFEVRRCPAESTSARVDAGGVSGKIGSAGSPAAGAQEPRHGAAAAGNGAAAARSGVATQRDGGGTPSQAPGAQPQDSGARLGDGRGDTGQPMRVTVHGSGETRLSPRELVVLSHLAAGLSNKAIAQAMKISGETVRAHVKSIFRKLGLENRTQAALWAVTLTSPDQGDRASQASLDSQERGGASPNTP
ncbi:response regulator transcription factor [Sphingomonas sp. PL-96]|uniref:response regulator transcription factor n=1 Tax=Sphingomonas sp. PL-96 TaxID=2887201 RepID=UPI001E2EAC4D|nr:response regulator transcription factor [Sphingomonas sp. PL-96]MCC2975156.1 response regulator transcription factor [Sphingomonas sp. PL-96]